MSTHELPTHYTSAHTSNRRSYMSTHELPTLYTSAHKHSPSHNDDNFTNSMSTLISVF